MRLEQRSSNHNSIRSMNSVNVAAGTFPRACVVYIESDSYSKSSVWRNDGIKYLDTNGALGDPGLTAILH